MSFLCNNFYFDSNFTFFLFFFRNTPETKKNVFKNYFFKRSDIFDTECVARTYKNLNSRTANDSQGLVRTCQVLTCATFRLTSPGPVLTSPGESWRYADKDWNTQKSKTESGPIRAEYVLYLFEKSVIGAVRRFFQCYLTNIEKNSLSRETADTGRATNEQVHKKPHSQ